MTKQERKELYGVSESSGVDGIYGDGKVRVTYIQKELEEWVSKKKKEWQDEAKKEAEEDLRLLKKSDYFAINSMQDLGEWWYETAPEGYTPIDDQDSEVLTKVKIGDVRFKGFFDCKKVHLFALPVPESNSPEIPDSSK